MPTKIQDSSSGLTPSQGAAADAVPAASTTAPHAVTAQIAEDDLKLELRNIHESLRRLESGVGDVNREANRRQMVNAPDMQSAMDPWSTANYGNLCPFGESEMVQGAYLPPRVPYLKHSCDNLDGSFAQLSKSVAKLPQLSSDSSSFIDASEAARAKVDVQILQDTTQQLGSKIDELRRASCEGEPTNANLISLVQEFNSMLKGMNETARRLWKDEAPRHK